MTVYHAVRPGAGLLERTGRTSAPRRTAGFGTGSAFAGTGTLARPGIGSGTLPRRRARGAARAPLSGGGVGIALAAIAIAFGLAFFSLSQTVRLTASGYDVDRLGVERTRLEAHRQELLNDLNRLGREPAIRKQAITLGLSTVTSPLVVGGEPDQTVQLSQ